MFDMGFIGLVGTLCASFARLLEFYLLSNCFWRLFFLLFLNIRLCSFFFLLIEA